MLLAIILNSFLDFLHAIKFHQFLCFEMRQPALILNKLQLISGVHLLLLFR
jgi:hypothetical protein